MGSAGPKVAPRLMTLIRGDPRVCRDFLDGASRTRTGDLLGAIRAFAALESCNLQAFCRTAAGMSIFRIAADCRRLPGVCPPELPFGGKHSAGAAHVVVCVRLVSISENLETEYVAVEGERRVLVAYGHHEAPE
jgi:hypothetical protein